jgi:serine/threonine protein kinase
VSVLINNRYRILQTLGNGGCGETFLAEDTHLPSRCRRVIKQLKPAAGDPATHRIIRERFKREAFVMERLGRACDQIPTLHAYFAEAGHLYLVQDLIEGQNLAQVVKEKGAFGESQVKSLLADLLPVLDCVHSQGIIHRDIKPENIMLRETDGRPVLIDFGAVKETIATVSDAHGASNSSIIIGSPGFIPTEQAAGKPIFSSDIYSLGLTAICLLTGRRPHELTDPYTGKIVWREHAAAVSSDIAALLEKAIHPYAHKRYRTAREMFEALQSVDTDSDLTVPQKLTHSYATKTHPSTSTPLPHFTTVSRSLRRDGRNDGSYRFLHAAALLTAVLLTVTLAFFYLKRGNYSATSNAANESAPQIRRTGQADNERVPTSASQAVKQTADFQIINTHDGFTSVRSAPTTKSVEVRRLYPGARITCLDMVKGESLWKTEDWRYCPTAGGYIHSKLLKKS